MRPCLVAALLLLPSPAGAQDLYSLDRSTPTHLRRVDPADGSTLSSRTVILAGAEGELAGDGLAQHPVTGELFALLRDAGAASRILVKLDPGSGRAERVGDTGESLVELTFDATGTLYAVSEEKLLFTVSTADATPTLVLALPNGAGPDRNVAFNPDDGLLYHFAGSGVANDPIDGQIFERVDLAGGPSVTGIPLPHQPNWPVGMTYLPMADEFLVAAGGEETGDRLYRLSPSGDVTFVGRLAHESGGLARLSFTEVYSIDGQAGMLHTISPGDGATLASVAITVAGSSVDRGQGLALRSDGTLFALLDLDGQDDDPRLATIDPGTGVATVVGVPGGRYRTLAFDATDVLFGATDDEGDDEALYTLSTSDASATLVRALGGGDDGEAIAFRATDDLLYHLSGNGPPSDPVGGEVFEAIGVAITPLPLPTQPFQVFALTWSPLLDEFVFDHSGQRYGRLSPDGDVSVFGRFDNSTGGLTFAPEPPRVAGTLAALAAAACLARARSRWS